MADDPRQPSDDAHREGAPITSLLAEYLLDGRICRDLACCRCGYNLRTLPRDANCPECDFPVLRSLYYLDLRYADPRWLRRISRGLMLVALMPPLQCGIALVILCSERSEHSFASPWDVGRLPMFVSLWMLGAWAFATPEPPPATRNVTRWLTRATAYALFGVSLACLVWRHTPFSPTIASTSLVLAFLINAASLIGYALELAKRLPTSQAHGDLRVMMKIAAVGFVITVVGIVILVGGNLLGPATVGIVVLFFLSLPGLVLVSICLIRLAYRIDSIGGKIARRRE